MYVYELITSISFSIYPCGSAPNYIEIQVAILTNQEEKAQRFLVTRAGSSFAARGNLAHFAILFTSFYTRQSMLALIYENTGISA